MREPYQSQPLQVSHPMLCLKNRRLLQALLQIQHLRSHLNRPLGGDMLNPSHWEGSPLRLTLGYLVSQLARASASGGIPQRWSIRQVTFTWNLLRPQLLPDVLQGGLPTLRSVSMEGQASTQRVSTNLPVAVTEWLTPVLQLPLLEATSA